MTSSEFQKLLGTKSEYIQKLAEKGIHTPTEMIKNMIPREYIHILRSDIPIEWQMMEFYGRVYRVWRRNTRNQPLTTIEIRTENDLSVTAQFFGQAYKLQGVKQGALCALTGVVKIHFDRTIQLETPNISLKTEMPKTREGVTLKPVYSESGILSGRWIEEKIQKILQEWHFELEDMLPEDICSWMGLMRFPEAVLTLHNPQNQSALDQAKRRYALDEILTLQLLSAVRKHKLQEDQAPKIELSQEQKNILIDGLPFRLTEGQKRIVEQSFEMIASGHRMNQLLQGDVGSGKTIIAQILAFATLWQRQSVLYLAPTEVLAKQIFEKTRLLFEQYRQNVGGAGLGLEDPIRLLTGSTTQAHKTALQAEIDAEEPICIIGTHALVQEKRSYTNVGLVIIDEQHRFGVLQRSMLKKQGCPHMLSMTATPIPRTLALTLYWEYDVSLLKEKPAGRREIVTRFVPEQKRRDCYLFCESEIQKGHQIFVVCPLVQDSESLGEVASATTLFQKLQEQWPDCRMALLHGKMSSQDKDTTLQAFRDKQYDVLVATSVIEVGIDIPNATVLIVEGSERFGLSQLHQLRGRVGRNDVQSYCFLFATKPPTDTTKERLDAFVELSDGFALADIDLALRGPWSLLWLQQSWIAEYKIANIGDLNLVEEAQKIVQTLAHRDPTFESFPLMYKTIEETRQQRESLD